VAEPIAVMWPVASTTVEQETEEQHDVGKDA
jgi:hypothetical protein